MCLVSCHPIEMFWDELDPKGILWEDVVPVDCLGLLECNRENLKQFGPNRDSQG